MSDDISYAELQEFVGAFWHHYDEAHFDQLSIQLDDDIRYTSRSDTGASAFEEMLKADLRGREATLAWLSAHRKESPYPLRHNSSNLFRVGVVDGITSASFYIFVTQITNSVPFAVSSGVVTVSVARRDGELRFTSMHAVLDTQESVPYATRASDRVNS